MVSKYLDSISKQYKENTKGLTINTKLLRSSSISLGKGEKNIVKFSRLPFSKTYSRIPYNLLPRRGTTLAYRIS